MQPVFVLATDGVDGDDAPLQCQHLQQPGYGGDFVGFGVSPVLTQNKGILRRSSADDVNCLLARPLSWGRCTVFPSMATICP